jgi:hypothetical protein
MKGVFHNEIDIPGITPHYMDIIAAKIGEAPCIPGPHSVVPLARETP